MPKHDGRPVMVKQVVVVRQDLVLSPGKLAVQVAHAAVEAFRVAQGSPEGRQRIAAWDVDGNIMKVVVGVADEQALHQIVSRLRDASLTDWFLVTDFGYTEVAAGTITCLGIGPYSTPTLKPITGHLSLY